MQYQLAGKDTDSIILPDKIAAYPVRDTLRRYCNIVIECCAQGFRQ